MRAFQRGAAESEFFPDSKTVTFGINVPKALGDFLALQALYETGGCAVAVSDAEIPDAVSELASAEGLFVCPEGVAAFAGLKKLRAENRLAEGDTAVALNTGAGIKYPDTLRFDLPYCPVGGTV